MNDIKAKPAEAVQDICVYSRKEIKLGGVREVTSFDEYVIVLITDSGELTVEGDGLHVGSLDTEKGIVTAQGRIDALYYNEREKKDLPKKGFFGRLFG